MPRRSKGPHLWLRPARRDGGKIVRAAVWIIKDAGRQIGTGCGIGEDREAQQKLAAYIAQKYQPERSERSLSEISVADVISIYADDVIPRLARPTKALERAKRLTLYFGDKSLDQVNASLCHAYEVARQGQGRSVKGKGGGAKRDLEDLRAAINHHRELGLHREYVPVVLPKRGEARQRWLSRNELARLLWVCWSTREVQEGERTSKRPLRHLCRFLILALYTGSRPGAVYSAAWDRGPGKSFIDLDNGLFYRLAEGAIATKKRQPVVRLAPRLIGHLRRWRKIDGQQGMVVTHGGLPIASIKTALKRACELAALDEGVTAYSLRHTCATWLVSKGVPVWDVAAHLGTSIKMIEQHYGHMAPNYGERAALAIGMK